MLDYDDENDDSESKLEPTHHSKLDVRKMRVDELRTELMARDLDTRGLKGQLIQRLKEALDLEKVSLRWQKIRTKNRKIDPSGILTD